MGRWDQVQTGRTAGPAAKASKEPQPLRLESQLSAERTATAPAEYAYDQKPTLGFPEATLFCTDTVALLTTRPRRLAINDAWSILAVEGRPGLPSTKIP